MTPPRVVLIGNIRDLLSQTCVDQVAGVCRVCGCTQEEGCIIDAGGQVVEIDQADTLPPGSTICSWVEPDLCSACVEAPAPAPLLYDGNGRPLRGTP